jgi:hypothetical protein
MPRTPSSIITAYPAALRAIKRQARRYLPEGARLTGGTLRVLPQPWIAPESWGLVLFAPARKAALARQHDLPDFCLRFLAAMNGAFVHELSLFGLPGPLDRSSLQCHDLQTANRHWARGYRGAEGLHFGASPWNDRENVGYFFAKRRFRALRPNGTCVGTWTSFSALLDDEVARAEAMMLAQRPAKAGARTSRYTR